MEQRIIELETRLTFQEKMVEDLNSVIVRQQDQIDELAETIKVLKRELKRIIWEKPETAKVEESIPPHY